MRPALVARLERFGVYSASSQRSIWIHGRSLDEFQRATKLIAALREALPSSYLLFTTPDASARAWLHPRYPWHHAVAPPRGSAAVMRRFFRQLDPVIAICLDDSLPPAALLAARNRGLPVLRLAEAEGDIDASIRDAIRRVMATLSPWLDTIRSQRPRDFHGRRRMRQLANSRVGKWLVATRSRRRIANWDGLRQRLGNPEAVLCLGNGPSSESPEVLQIEHDCLMRVNHRWRDRGILTQPNMVFVGDLSTTREISGCVFGFRVILKEQEILLRHLLFGHRLDQLEHFTVERVSSLLDDRAWSANPTNGALMVATAVMLQPKRLVIAGIDLFRDPRGSYPGDGVAANDYLPGHERSCDLEVIAHALDCYRGELVILSPMLAEALSTSVPLSRMFGGRGLG